MIRAERGGGCVTGMPTITPGVKSGVPFQFGTRYGPIRTRGTRRHGVMPGAGTFLHRVDQSERRTVQTWRDAGRWNFSAGI